MAKNYFRNIPDFEYVNRTKDGQFISNYTQVKNFFKKGKIREDLFQDLTVFEKYNVKGDDRPDNVANEIYGDPNLDWVVLLSNNIVNVQSEWPLSQADFYVYITNKYDSEETLYSGIHHYESTQTSGDTKVKIEVFNEVDSDAYTGLTPITNREYEEQQQDQRRKIRLLDPSFVEQFIDEYQKLIGETAI